MKSTSNKVASFDDNTGFFIEDLVDFKTMMMMMMMMIR